MKRIGTLASLLIVSMIGICASASNITNSGLSVPAISGYGRVTAQTSAAASFVTYTVGAADASFDIGANINVTASTTHSFTVVCVYTDETNTSQTVTFTFVEAGTPTPIQTITNVTGVGAYSGMTMRIRCKASSSIAISTAAGGTYTSVTFNAEGSIIKID